jgi:hypothetical protein
MVNGIDETGWIVAAQLRWLWMMLSEQVTVCNILPGRSFEQAASLLGADYEGWLNHDGWAVYYKFLWAGHQSCISRICFAAAATCWRYTLPPPHSFPWR